jgi:outer membrane protein OmpA-like peptidoglycan-associated protein
VSSDRRPAAVTVMSESDVNRLFGEALAALPPPARHFTLYFRFESDELTDDSRALLPEVLETVKHHVVPDVAVVGHTDTMGAKRANVALGLKRATMVRDLLIRAGLDRTLIEATSHGETDLLVRTANDTAEPRNRRVEISVR